MPGLVRAKVGRLRFAHPTDPCPYRSKPSPEDLLIDLVPTRRVGIDLFRAVDDSFVIALQMVLALRRDRGVHRFVVRLAKDFLTGLGGDEVQEQLARVGMRRALGDASDLER